MTAILKFPEVQLRQICQCLAEVSPQLTGSQIGELLRACGIDDLLEGGTKRTRLFEALNRRQVADGVGNHVGAFIEAAFSPVRFLGQEQDYEDHRSNMNKVLSFSGLMVREDGKLRAASAARTLDEAERRAIGLRKELGRRHVHPDVMRFCRAELLQDNYFHAVFEATKSVADKIRDKTGLSEDGAELIDRALGLKDPMLAFNSLQTETERSEHTGLANLLRGLFGTFRNTTAHAPKINWRIDEQDAMDMLTLASLLHRRLDDAVSTRP
jgi:uncharacterized protein (TIGR02391 family)